MVSNRVGSFTFHLATSYMQKLVDTTGYNQLATEHKQMFNKKLKQYTERKGETERAEHQKFNFKITLYTYKCAQRALYTSS